MIKQLTLLQYIEKSLIFSLSIILCRPLSIPPNWFEIARPHSKRAIEVKLTDLFYIDDLSSGKTCFLA